MPAGYDQHTKAVFTVRDIRVYGCAWRSRLRGEPACPGRAPETLPGRPSRTRTGPEGAARARQHTTEHFRQAGAGRPGPATTYKKVTASHWKVTITIDDQQVRDDAATDGCYPLVTNGRQFTDLYVVEAYHGQPHLERRHHILKGVQDAAPIWVNNIERIDAVFCCHFIAQVIGALIERQIRAAMAAADIAKRGCVLPCGGRPAAGR